MAPSLRAQSRQDQGHGRDFLGVKTLEWSADGTALLASDEDRVIRTYLIPADLMEESRSKEDPIEAISSYAEPENIYSTAFYPYFDLQQPSSTIFLSASASQPIRLVSALVSRHLASYPMINPHNESFITPHSLSFARSGQAFAAGSNSQIAFFELARPGEGPIATLPTIPSRRSKRVGNGVGMKGIISSLDESDDGILAAGTFTRSIGLYSQGGKGECIATWQLGTGEGNGISQVFWDKVDSSYLYVAERISDCIRVYDVRNSSTEVGQLVGRNAFTNQRLYVRQVLGRDGSELWAGSTDGMCHVWQDARSISEYQHPTTSWKAHTGPLTAIASHYSGVAIATSSSRDKVIQSAAASHQSEVGEDETISPDSGLKLWATG